MDFRVAKPEDRIFVEEHALYPEEQKSTPNNTDFDFVLEHGDYIIGIGGFRLITDTTAWAWVQLTSYVGHHMIETVRVIIEYMDIFCKKHKILRLQAWVEKGFEQGINTVNHLGFFREGPTMKDFLGKGRDAYLYVKHYDGE